MNVYLGDRKGQCGWSGVKRKVERDKIPEIGRDWIM